MPRQKTVQPLPKDAFQLQDGTLVEIRDWRTKEIGRGQDKKFQSDELDWQVLGGLIDDLRSGCSEREKRAADALASNAAMERFEVEVAPTHRTV